MKFINKYRSPNFNLRSKNSKIKFIIIHYTAIKSDKEAINHLCNKKNEVSAHFFINKLGKVFYLVDVNNRAWHAGVSNWQKIKDINSYSIGIELDNTGHVIEFENYTFLQIASLEQLLKYLKKKYKIDSQNILAHSDIAPYRKIDPGEKFPWNKLLRKNIVLFLPKPSIKISIKIDDYLLKLKLISVRKRSLYMLSKIGYDTSLALKSNQKYNMLIKAYQMHYNRTNVSGILDENTFMILKSHFNISLTI